VHISAPGYRDIGLLQASPRLAASFTTACRSTWGVHFPRPLWPFISDAVLVESLEPGRIVRWFVYNKHRQNCAIAQIGLRAYLQMMLIDNFVHADLHPGNLLVDIQAPWLPLPRWLKNAADNATEAVLGRALTDCLTSTTLIILDAGMTVSLKAQHLQALSDLYRGIARTDGAAIAQAMLRLRHQESAVLIDVSAFKADICSIFESVDAEVFREHTQAIVDRVFNVMRQHHITVDGAASAVLISTVTLEVRFDFCHVSRNSY
jgi:aarF domain-containing kinase